MSQAEDYYYHYRKKYNDCLYMKARSERNEDSYRSQKSQRTCELSDTKDSRRAQEKRLDDVDDLVRMMDGNARWGLPDVPDQLNKDRKSIEKLNTCFQHAIRMTDLTSNLENAFLPQTVEQNYHSKATYSGFVSEQVKLRNEIENLKNRERHLKNTISELDRHIRDCNAEQRQLRRNANYNYYEMKYWLKKWQNEE